MKKNYVKERYTEFAEWYRNRGIGGSSVSALFDENKYLSAIDIYLASLFPNQEPVETENENTRYGKVAEPIIRDIVKLNFEGKYKVHTPKGYELYRDINYPFLTATLDGTMTDLETKEKWVLEIKTREMLNASDEEEWNGHIPQRYFIQVLHYLGVLNDFVGAYLVAKLRWVDFDTGLVKREEIRYYKLLRKDFEQDIELVRQKAIDFELNNIEAKCPPDINIGILRKEEN